MNLENVKIYRMTHIENIPHILEYGITHKNSPNTNPNFKNIGDISLIETRANKTVTIDNGEIFSNNNKSITLGDFIPFYFGIKMPMLYVTQQGGNFVEKATNPEDIVYIAIHLNLLIESENDFYFTDGHATDNLTSFYDKSMINELTSIIDWKAVKAPFWGGHDNLNIKRKK